jgi:hypothetical protein
VVVSSPSSPPSSVVSEESSPSVVVVASSLVSVFSSALSSSVVPHAAVRRKSEATSTVHSRRAMGVLSEDRFLSEQAVEEKVPVDLRTATLGSRPGADGIGGMARAAARRRQPAGDVGTVEALRKRPTA